LLERLRAVAADPSGPHLFVRPIMGEAGLHRLRHGDWRAIYRLDRAEDVMVVEHVAHRREVYR
jgi:mRNA interferase RelE/StbE